MSEERGRGFTTRAIHGAVPPPIEQIPASVPIYQTSTFRFDTSHDYAETISFRKPGYTYTRGYGNPTLLAFERVMSDLEGTQSAFSFASGMAAMHTVFTTLAATGDRIATSNELYGGAFSLFTKVMPRYGIEVTFVDPHDLDAVAGALPGAAFFYVETIANPNVTVADLEAIGALCRASGVPGVVDNTFASPALCNPSTHGFEFVLHSATKYVGGHHDLIGGVVCCSQEGMGRVRDTVLETGGTMAPFEAWLCMRGLMTLEIRMQRHSSNAMQLARFLEGHPKVERVHYPGLPSHPDHGVARRELGGGMFGGMMAVEVAGGVEGGMRFCDALEVGWVATSLGGVHTLVGHAASTTHRQLDPEARRRAGIADGLVRVSVGLENVEDLIEDFARALEKA
ncbi:MAG: aminotransferase class I/II-fold pyridoxal phosphate-dependent enzyme [Actinobacteria bacterium]|nr:aminotransferase class I/II-fold pyridoxal phosphate-dependent enzyme [Actinomycetota bacterium]